MHDDYSHHRTYDSGGQDSLGGGDLNLSTHRAPESVWDRRGWDGQVEPTLARWLVGAGGGVLAAEGLRRRGATGGFFVALGGGLMCWALAGEDDLARARRWFEDILELAPWRHVDVVHEASADSFPASDPPSSFNTGIRSPS